MLAVSGRKACYAGAGTDRPFLRYVEDNGTNSRNDLWINGIQQTSDGRLGKSDVAITP